MVILLATFSHFVPFLVNEGRVCQSLSFFHSHTLSHSLTRTHTHAHAHAHAHGDAHTHAHTHTHTHTHTQAHIQTDTHTLPFKSLGSLRNVFIFQRKALFFQ